MATITTPTSTAVMRAISVTHVPLPAEIIKLIAHQLRDNRQALHACLLVSRAWSQAAVEYLYKAEHMRIDQNIDILWSIATSTSSTNTPTATVNTVPVSPVQTSLQGADKDNNDSSNDSDFAMLMQDDVNDSGHYGHVHLPPVLGVLLTLAPQDRRPEILSQLLLKRTLDDSILHDLSCSYDYISYLNRVSCPLEPSVARQEHSFNRLVRKVARRCTSVEVFCSSFMVHVDTLVYAIRHFHSLTWIDLKDCQELNDEVFIALAETVRSLSFIRLPGAMMKEVSIEAVTKVIQAQEKDSLVQFKVIHGTNIFETDEILKALGQRHGGSMKRLTLSICDLENAGLDEFGPLLLGLESLNLEYASGVTNEVMIPILDKCRQLHRLDLTETDCTQVTIQALSTPSDSTTAQPGRFANLSRLIINNIDAPFQQNQFLALAEVCPNLRELHMNSILADTFLDFDLFLTKMAQITDLDIGNVFPEFTDANLTSLVDALPRLRWLSIANTQITNVSLIHLAERATQLCDLCILGCDQVTKPGLIEFLDKLANKLLFRRMDITYCRLDETSVTEIREKVQQMAHEFGVPEVIEVEGDDQFADSLAEDEEDEGEERDEDDGQDTDQDTDHEVQQEVDQGAEHDESDEFESLHDVADFEEDALAAAFEVSSLTEGTDIVLPSGPHLSLGTTHDIAEQDEEIEWEDDLEQQESDENTPESDSEQDEEEVLSDFSDTLSDREEDSLFSQSALSSSSSSRGSRRSSFNESSMVTALGHQGILQMLEESQF
ncbi:hypothetical protein BGZ83_012073 [Gryganskiella cystojenkinii]|nr:hypothetical protein BGZ83_012073 [Gryganskiella cystojenkinii]